MKMTPLERAVGTVYRDKMAEDNPKAKPVTVEDVVRFFRKRAKGKI